MFWICGGEAIAIALERCLAGRAGWCSTQLRHVRWEGMHFEDLIMPLFMFLAGVSLPFSVSGRLSKDPSNWRFWGHVVKRFLILWVFGMAAGGRLLSWDPSKWMFYSNTLQAIAAGCLIATVLYRFASVRWQIVATAGLLLVTWALFAWVPAPGRMAGDYTSSGNVAIWLEKFIMGGHRDDTAYTWILSSLNFGATTMMGVFGGELLRNPALSGNRKSLWLAVGGAAAVGLSFLWMPFHPIIKHLWTGSFVLLSGGLSLLLLALCYWVIDVRGWKRWSYFFAVIGSNAILVYMMTEIWGGIPGAISRPLVRGFEQWLSGDPMELVKAVANMAFLWLILLHLHRQKIYLKI